jgi:heme/copper-type cytochrome/quinol oxidase subunit 4
LKKSLPYLIAVPLAAFGLLTLFLSTSIIFDLFGIRAKEGNYVLFVVWANFICSLLYLFAAYGFIKAKKWTFLVLGLATIILIITFIIFIIHIYSGGIYETKTVGALIFRTIITLIFVFLAYFIIAKKYKTIKAN